MAIEECGGEQEQEQKQERRVSGGRKGKNLLLDIGRSVLFISKEVERASGF